jgi:hypothetical protein
MDYFEGEGSLGSQMAVKLSVSRPANAFTAISEEDS